MRLIEIGTGYTSIPAKVGAATEIVVEELTKSFLNEGIEAIIFDIKDTNRSETNLPIVDVYMPQFFSNEDTKLGILHKIKRVFYSSSLAWRLYKYLKYKDEKTVLHFHNQYNLYFFLKLTRINKRKNITIAYTIHSYIWQGQWNDIKSIVKKRYFQEVYCCKYADKIFVLNEDTEKHLVNQFNIDKNKIYQIPNGVNIDTYYPMIHSQKEKLKIQWKLKNKRLFFQAGSICERKNQLTAIKLLLPLLKQYKDVCYYYAGGIISHEYKALIDDYVFKNGLNDQVLYLGELQPGEQLNELYNLSTAFIFPSTLEGFSLVILEAMSAGTPILVDKNSGLKIPENCTGCICFDNEQDFLEKTKKLFDYDFYEIQSISVRNCIEEIYSWDKISKIYYSKF